MQIISTDERREGVTRGTTAAVLPRLQGPGTSAVCLKVVVVAGGQEGQQQGSSRASGCPRSAHIIDTATEGAGEGARCYSIRCARHNPNPRGRKAHSA